MSARRRSTGSGAWRPAATRLKPRRPPLQGRSLTHKTVFSASSPPTAEPRLSPGAAGRDRAAPGNRPRTVRTVLARPPHVTTVQDVGTGRRGRKPPDRAGFRGPRSLRIRFFAGNHPFGANLSASRAPDDAALCQIRRICRDLAGAGAGPGSSRNRPGPLAAEFGLPGHARSGLKFR